MAKRRPPKITKAGIRKILASPRVNPGLKAYWRKRLRAMGG